MSFNEEDRKRILQEILGTLTLTQTFPNEVRDIQTMLSSSADQVPKATIPQEAWNSDRLSEMLDRIDREITSDHPETAITLIYTSLEGLLKAFVRKNAEDNADETKLTRLSRIVSQHIRQSASGYPDDVTKLIHHYAYSVERTRNQFSDSHFGEECDKWVAVFLRDSLHAIARLLLVFM